MGRGCAHPQTADGIVQASCLEALCWLGSQNLTFRCALFQTCSRPVVRRLRAIVLMLQTEDEGARATFDVGAGPGGVGLGTLLRPLQSWVLGPEV